MRALLFITISVLTMPWLTSCTQEPLEQSQKKDTASSQVAESNSGGNGLQPSSIQLKNFQQLQNKTIYGTATLSEVKELLTYPDLAGLTNSMHAMYAMRWHRGVLELLSDLWQNNQTPYPKIVWEEINKPPVRIALASTLARINQDDKEEWLNYIHSHKDDAHEFHKAQTIIALGFNADPADIKYIKTQIEGDNRYVTQTSITALAIMENPQAKNTMIELLEDYKDNPRATLLRDLLKKVYSWEE